MMKEQLWLLLSGVACSMAAWAFWHYLDTDAVAVLLTLAVVSAVVDNMRLRRKLRETQRRG